MERHECYETFYELYEYVCISLEVMVDRESHPHVYTSLSFTWDRVSLVPSVVVKHYRLRNLAEKLQFWQQDFPTLSSLLSELKEWQYF